MSIKIINVPMLYCEDDLGHYKGIFEVNDRVLVKLVSGEAIRGVLTSIKASSIDIMTENEDYSFELKDIEKIACGDY